MRRVFQKELVIYITLLTLLALLVHPDLLESPSSRFASMMERGNVYHPFIYALILYFILYILRFVFRKITFLLTKLKRNKS